MCVCVRACLHCCQKPGTKNGSRENVVCGGVQAHTSPGPVRPINSPHQMQWKRYKLKSHPLHQHTVSRVRKWQYGAQNIHVPQSFHRTCAVLVPSVSDTLPSDTKAENSGFLCDFSEGGRDTEGTTSPRIDLAILFPSLSLRTVNLTVASTPDRNDQFFSGPAGFDFRADSILV